jgi:hypothetical protein
MAPSNETEAETLRRRQVEALEAIAEHLGFLATVADHIDTTLETLATVVEEGGDNGHRRWKAFLRVGQD